MPGTAALDRAPSLERIDDATWNEAWSSAEGATFFQSPSWGEVWSRYLGGGARAEAWRASFDDGGTAVVPVFATRTLGGLGRRLQLSPAGTYGGPFGPGLLRPEAVVSIVTRLRSKRTEGVWRWSPWSASGACPDGPGVARDHTLALDLEPGLEAVRQRFSRTHRASLAKARRSGVEVRLAAGQSDWSAYDELYRESLERWGETATSRYDRSLFDALRELGGDRVRLWLAAVGGDLAAGALCVYARRHVAYWHGASREALLPFRPVHLMFEAAIEDACGRGLRWFDFNPSGGHSGVERFKQGFGATAFDAPVVRWASPLLRRWRALRGGAPLEPRP